MTADDRVDDRRLVAARRHLPGVPPQLRRRRTATASATSPACGRSCPTSPTSASTRSGSPPGTRRRRPTPATTSPTTATSTRVRHARRARGADRRGARRGIRVILDIVPNHTSDQHLWFQAALAAAPGSPERERYMFRDGRGADGELPPNDWELLRRPGVDPGHRARRHARPVVPAPVRARAARPQLGAPRGPRGVRGRPAVLVRPRRRRLPHRRRPRLIKDGRPARRRATSVTTPTIRGRTPVLGPRRVHDVYRAWRRIADAYDPPRVFVAEAWVPRPDEARCGTCAPTSCTRRSTSTSSARRGRPTTCARSSIDARRARTRRRAAHLGAVQPRRRPRTCRASPACDQIARPASTARPRRRGRPRARAAPGPGRGCC